MQHYLVCIQHRVDLDNIVSWKARIESILEQSGCLNAQFTIDEEAGETPIRWHNRLDESLLVMAHRELAEHQNADALLTVKGDEGYEAIFLWVNSEVYIHNVSIHTQSQKHAEVLGGAFYHRCHDLNAWFGNVAASDSNIPPTNTLIGWKTFFANDYLEFLGVNASAFRTLSVVSAIQESPKGICVTLGSDLADFEQHRDTLVNAVRKVLGRKCFQGEYLRIARLTRTQQPIGTRIPQSVWESVAEHFDEFVSRMPARVAAFGFDFSTVDRSRLALLRSYYRDTKEYAEDYRERMLIAISVFGRIFERETGACIDVAGLGRKRVVVRFGKGFFAKRLDLHEMFYRFLAEEDFPIEQMFER